MNQLLVSYDLVAPRRDYASLYAALAALHGRRVLHSTWVVRTSRSAVDLRDHLKQYVDADDRILVNDFDHWASYKALIDINHGA